MPDLGRSLDQLEDPAFAALHAAFEELDGYVEDARGESRAISAVELDQLLTGQRTRYLPPQG